MSSISSLLWLSGGDFNEILRLEEKRGGVFRYTKSMLDFNITLSDCGLQDIAGRGNPLTWSNRRSGSNLIEERLDRFICTQNWKEAFKGVVAYNVEAYGLYHFPITIDISKKCRLANKNGRSRRFHYENFWSLYEDCRSLFAQVWRNNEELCNQDPTLIFLK